MDQALKSYRAGNSAELDKTRGELLSLISPTYSRLLRHHVSQLHFHLPDNKSFLRLHKPDTYGDDLTSFRETVRTVNATRHAIQGFEQGRYMTGFRTVFPLFHHGVHVGSVELGAAFKDFCWEMEKMFSGTFIYAVKRSKVETLANNSLRKEFQDSDISIKFLYGKDFSNVPQEDRGPAPGMYTISLLNRILRPRIQDRLDRNDFFVEPVQLDYRNFLVAYFPVRDFNDQVIAYLISYIDSRDIGFLRHDYIKYIVLANLGIILFIAFLRSALSHNRIIRENRERIMAISTAIQDGLVLTDRQGSIVYENPAVSRILGARLLDLGTYLQECIAVYMSGRELPFAEWGMLSFQGDNGFFSDRGPTFDIKIRSFISDPVPVDATWTSIGDGNSEGYLLVFRDITGLRRYHRELIASRQTAEAASRQLAMSNQRLEKALANARQLAIESQMASHAKSHFLANMSHELRTPMNAVIGISGMIMGHGGENLNEKQLEGLQLINRNGKRLLTLINDLLDMAKIEAGKMSFRMSPFTLRTLVLEVSGIVEGLLQDNEIMFEWFIDPDVPEVIVSDQKRLHQVLVNLLGNSAKFTERGSISLRVALENDKILFTVHDTGIGIEDEKIKSVFEEFTQASEDDSRKFGGSGLGLTISRKLVHGLGGDMKIDSVFGNGTTVSFWIPLVLGDQNLGQIS